MPEPRPRPARRPLSQAIREALAYRLRWPGLSRRHIAMHPPGLGAAYLIATRNGLLLLHGDGRLDRLVAGALYGIAVDPGRVYIFQGLGRRGRILRIERRGRTGLGRARVLVGGLSPGCHQMDLAEGRLFVCDTYHNRILEIDADSGARVAEHLPLAPLQGGRSAPDYARMNSIHLRRGAATVLCHNETHKTGRPSELLQLDADFRPQRRMRLDAHSAHNCVPMDGRWLICDSSRGRLLWGEQTLLQTDAFARGLAVGDELVLLGGSSFEHRREHRGAGWGRVRVLDRPTWGLLATLPMPGHVQEIRRLDGPDLGLSQCGIDQPLAQPLV